eukprot:g2850.t1
MDSVSNPVTNYNAEQIQVLEGLDPVRKRPGMYIGSTSQKGLHHLVYEVLDNAIDEVQAGFADTIHLEIYLKEGRVCITDNGRGIPTEIHPQTKKSALETVLTVLHAGGKFGGDQSGYTISGGLHGVGLSVVNALSKELQVVVWRDGQEFSQSFSRGQPLGAMKSSIQNQAEEKSGTRVEFQYDPTIFSNMADYDPHVLTSRFREVAFLNKRATLHYRFVGEDPSGEDQWKTFHYEGGLSQFVQFINQGKTPIHKPIFFTGNSEETTVELALQWCNDAFSENVVGFVNNVKTPDGGTHLEGFKSALTRTLNALARNMGLLKEGESNLAGDFLREGLGAIVSVKIADPEFEGQTKTRLGNPHVRRVVDHVVSEEMTLALEMDTSTLHGIIEKALHARRASEAAKKARDLVRKKSLLTKSTLPGKLADCTGQTDRQTELFIVEGDSAGGSTKQGRDRRFQAVLPLRGKILNTERSDEEAIYRNKELVSLIVALGLEQNQDDMKGLRYDKIIILTDADVDGAHIRALLLTFFFRYRRALFENGKVFVAVPPLYKVKLGKKEHYCYSDGEVEKLLKKGKARTHSIQRFKGLGEMMPEQLWQTTLNPETRVLRRLTSEDMVETSHVFDILMGTNVAQRKQFIAEKGQKIAIQNLDI